MRSYPGASLLKNGHGRYRADNDIVVAIEENSGREGDSNPADLSISLDVLPERALLVGLLTRRWLRAVHLRNLLSSRIAILLFCALVIGARHDVVWLSDLANTLSKAGRTKKDKWHWHHWLRDTRLAHATGISCNKRIH